MQEPEFRFGIMNRDVDCCSKYMPSIALSDFLLELPIPNVQPSHVVDEKAAKYKEDQISTSKKRTKAKDVNGLNQ